MKFKKVFCSIVLFLSLVSAVNADEFTDLLQDLAMQTACIGRSSTAETGVLVTSRYDDPPDLYDPPMLANRFASMSGNKTRIETFYGVCFDYAQFAYDDIKKYQAAYNKAGMKDKQWYIAGANKGDPYTIILYDPVPPERATTIVNGVYVKEHFPPQRVRTHDDATGHAWLWVQHKNGTWYWIDPTWTDNTGYVWWGIVQNGKEVQFYPDPKYCVASNYPNASKPETLSPASTYADDALVNALAQAIINADLKTKFGPMALILGYNAPFDSDSDSAFGLSLSVEQAKKSFIVPYIPFSLSFDWIVDEGVSTSYYTSTGAATSLILGTAFGYPALDWLLIYAGGGLGINLDLEETYDIWEDSTNDSNADKSIIAWKLNGGLRFMLYDLFAIKLDVSFGTIIGPTFGIGAGIAFK
jgi:opacity protein-like surface antigen